VTPQMVAPITPGQLPITGPGTNTEPPASHEFYLDGFVEVPQYNPVTDPIGSAGQVDLVTPYDCPPGGATPPSIPPAGDVAPPIDLPPPELGRRGAVDNRVLQTSGTRAAATSRRSTTLGTMSAERTAASRSAPAATRAAASVKPNSGDDLRAGETAGHSAGRTPARYEIIEPAGKHPSRAEDYKR